MMFTRLVSSMLALSAFAAAADSCQNVVYPAPEMCEGPACANPAGVLDYQDFSVIRRVSDGQYFRYAKSNSTGHGLSVATAPALRGPWSYQFEVLNELTGSYVSNRTDTDVWAPDVKFFNDTYYLFYSFHTNDHSIPLQTFDLCVATSPTMDADSWVDHGPMDVPGVSDPTEYVRLDGNLIANASNPSGIAIPYMAFGSYNWGVYGVNVSDDFLRVATTNEQPAMLVADQQNPGEYPGNKTEGPYQLEKDGFIYLFYSIGNCCPALDTDYADSVYRVEVCRTPTATPQGPYVNHNGNPCAQGGPDDGTVVLASQPDGSVFSPGSVGVLDDPDEGGLVMYYQYFNLSAKDTEGIRFGFNYLEFGEDGWPTLVAERSG